MPGTRAGGLKAAETNRLKYGEDFYVNIGRKGGRIGRTGGFAASHERAVKAGRKGGFISSRSENKAPLWQRRKFYREAKRSGKLAVQTHDGENMVTYRAKPSKKWLEQFEEKRKRAERSRNETV